MATLQSTLKLTLLDQVSARAKAINRSLDGLNRTTHGLLAMSRNIAAFAAGYVTITEGFDKTFNAASKMESALTEIGIKSGLTSTQLDMMQKRLTALSPRTNQFTTDMLAGVDAMTTMGLSADQAMGSIEAISKTATATGATIEDLSKASTASIQNMGVMPDQVAKMLDAMALAGNRGAFELKDMAQYFPQLSASAKTLGIDGVDGVADLAAALQIARRGTGDASTAATNLSDFMSKIVTPQTIKNFKKFGVNVTKELQTAHKKGISPIEHSIKLLDEKTEGGKGELLTQIFGDKQTLDFIRPMIAGLKDYVAIREDAERANGVVDEAFGRRMTTAEQKVKSLKIAIGNLGESIGANLLQPIGNAAKYLAGVFNSLAQRFTIVDRIGAAFDGFAKGLGFAGGKAFVDSISSVLKELRDFIFGTKDASRAADEMGRVFGRFHEWGKQVRAFGDDIAYAVAKVEKFLGLKPGTIVDTLGKIGGLGVKLALAGAGIGIAAAAIKTMAGALYWLSGASTAVGILSTIAGLSSKLNAGANAVALSTAATQTGTMYGTLFATAAGAAIAVGILAALRELDPKGDLWGTTTKFDAWVKEKTGWSPSQDGLSVDQVTDAALPFKKGARTLYDLLFPAGDPNRQSARPDPGGYDMAGRHAFINSPAGVAQDAAARATAPQRQSRTVTIDAASISAMVQPSGTQSVRVENQQPPSITMSNVFHITGVSNPEAAANSAASQLGAKVKSAVESTNTD